MTCCLISLISRFIFAICFRLEEGPQSRQLRRPVHLLQMRETLHMDRLIDETPSGGLRQVAQAQVHPLR